MIQKLTLAVVATNILRIASAVKDGETVSIGSNVFEFATDGAITAGRILVDVSGGSSAAASKVLTFATNVEDGDTVTAGSQVYTFKTALTASTTAGEVLIGEDLTESRDNLIAAIMKAAGGGTTYGSATVRNALVNATATSTDALTATARVKGTDGNSIAIAEASTHASWASSATALSGGVDPTAAEAIAALVTAMDATALPFSAQAVTGGILVIANQAAPNLAFAETLSGSNNAWASAAALEGTTAKSEALIYSRNPTATEVALGVIVIPFAFAVKNFILQVRTSTGAAKAFGGTAVLSGNVLTITNTSSTDFAATDSVVVFAAA